MSGPVDPRRLVESVEASERAAEELDEERELLGSEAEARAAYDLTAEQALHAAPVDADAALHRRSAPTDAEGRAAIRGRRQWPLPKQADPSAPLLVVENLKTYFTLESGTVKAVDGVSFTLDDGEALGIAGESGCGKTTTALSLVRLLPSNATIVEGSIKLFGIDLVPKSENALRRYRWREISIVFQGAMNALNPVRRVGEQIAEPLEERLGIEAGEARKRASELLELVGIPKARRRAYPHELSGGMRLRAMIAMALACDPAIVIGDEPTTALDVMVQAQILELLEDLRERLGLSLILITHDLSVIAETCDRVLIMYAGRVAEDGRVDEVFRRPRHPYTQKLLAAFPNIHADRRTLDVIPGSPPDLRNPPPGCRFAPRCSFAMAICTEVVPPEVTFDRVRVACHLYPEGSDGVPVTTPTADAIGATAALEGVPG
jgi:oligopeptide/dipeptide ABC transporter ATP-binding protein